MLKLFIFLFGFFLLVCHAWGVDNLYLSGHLKSFDKSKGIVTVYVLTEGCQGLRQFFWPKDLIEELDSSLIDKRIEFYIDSSVCEKGKIHRIIFR